MKWIVSVVLVIWAGSGFAANARTVVDDFDGSTRVSVDPHGLSCGMSMVCPLLGARWTSTRADDAVLQVEVINEYVAIEGVSVNIDGQIVELEPLTGDALSRYSSNVETAGRAPLARRSSRDFLAPLELVQRMHAAGNVRVRVHTRDGSVDGVLSGERRPSKAHAALGRFLSQVP